MISLQSRQLLQYQRQLDRAEELIAMLQEVQR